ncbi:MAG: nucleotide sugar dehydrogenase [Nitrososphaerales archaeon]
MARSKTAMHSEGGILAGSVQELKKRLRSGDLRVAVVGLGRIGLPTAAVFADGGATVVGLDIQRKVVQETNSGKCALADEPGLPELVKKNTRRGRLRATLSPAEAIASADFVIICVPTPVDQMKSPDYSAVIAASQVTGESLRKGSVVIVESTIGPGIAEGVILPILEEKSGMKVGVDFGLASCPERSDPGNILANMGSIPRIVGSTDPKCTELVAALYESALGVKAIRASNPKTANAIKLTENLFRDVNIALANEFALLFEELGIDTMEVIKACATKHNFMPHYPGVGVGGPCLPSNSYYLIGEGMKTGYVPNLIRMARETNDRMPDHVVELVSEALNDVGKTVRGSKVAVLGVSYKPGMKDIQLTPVERVVSRLTDMGASISLYDPMFKGEKVFGLPVCKSLEEASKAADCIVIGTAHKEFETLDLGRLARLAAKKAAFVDGRNVANPKEATKQGFAYRGVGRRYV